MLDITGNTGLNGDTQTLIELHRSNGVERRADVGSLDRRGPNAEVLLHRWTDFDTCVIGIVRIDGHQLHVHEWRLARFVKAWSRHHGVMPVEDLALACGSLGFRGGYGLGGSAFGGQAANKEATGCQQYACRNQ